jgi:hypothetical protein
MPEGMQDVLASIRALVSSEEAARSGGAGRDEVVMLTRDMRVGAAAPRAGELLAEGLDPDDLARLQPAPILDEEALRGIVNAIVREELQGELGDRIARNLRKLIRREIGQMLDERNQG